MSITAPEWVTPNGMLGQAKANVLISISLQASGASNYMLDGGILPPGLALSQFGSISGAPTTPGEHEFIVCACNGVSRSSRCFSLIISA